MSYLDPTLRRMIVVTDNEDSLRRAALRAITQNTSTFAAKAVALFGQPRADRAVPIATGGQDMAAWSRWHEGADIALYAIGDSTLLERCELTENERERLLLLARRAASHQEKVYVVATKREKKLSRTLPQGLICQGLIFYQ